MKYALVNGQRQEAQPDLLGVCPACGSPMVARCGDVRRYHWAHRGKRDCDHWWEPETEWHRSWKNMFPTEWQEYIHHAESGEKHIADVKTDQGWVFEFQHSHIEPEERKAREVFYCKLIWIVDGTRRKRDRKQFIEAMHGDRSFDECTLFKEWHGSSAFIFFDFSENNNPKEDQLWCMVSLKNGNVYIIPFTRSQLIQYHSQDALKAGLDFTAFIKGYINNSIAEENKRRHQQRENIMRELALRNRRPRGWRSPRL